MIEEQKGTNDDEEQAYALIVALAKRMGKSIDGEWYASDVKALALGIANLCDIVESLYE